MKHNVTFSMGGIHPPQSKHTAHCGIDKADLPKTAVVMLSQHIGAAARPIVKPGDKVSRGQLLAEPASAISAAVHSPITGTVKSIGATVTINGYSGDAITITATDEQHEADEQQRRLPPDNSPDASAIASLTATEVIDRIRAAGVVGLGGATFPSSPKTSLARESHTDILIINGCECEPYLTCDDALMQTYPHTIAAGVEILRRAIEARHAVIAIENNKPDAIAAITAAISKYSEIRVQALRTKYPQGGEKQLVEAVSGRCIPSGELPTAVGVVVHNVATAYAVSRAVLDKQPLIERVITISNNTGEPRGNYLAAIGTPITELPGITPAEGDKVICGGPMMGRAVTSLQATVTKGSSGFLVLREARKPQAQACIRCSRCVSACPMGLEPYLLSVYGKQHMADEAEAAYVTDCIECGSCSYICPSHRPLLDYIRLAKGEVKARQRARNSASKK